MINARRSVYLYRLGYFRSITKSNDAEFRLAMNTWVLSEPMWEPNPFIRERKNLKVSKRCNTVTRWR